MIRLKLAPIFATVALWVASSAASTSFVSVPPHDPDIACTALKQTLAVMTGKQKSESLWPLYHTEDFGTVEYHEKSAFLKSMISVDGRPDKDDAKIGMVWPVGKRKDGDSDALYVVQVRRYQWHPQRESGFDPMHTEPEGYEISHNYWLATFLGNEVYSMHEGLQYFDFVDYDRRLKGCSNG